jgi:hypothetical protein
MATASLLSGNAQRVALALDDAGRKVYITREWLKALEEINAAATPPAPGENAFVTQAQFVLLEERVTELEADVAALQAALEALELAPFDPNTILFDDEGRIIFDSNGRVITTA